MAHIVGALQVVSINRGDVLEDHGERSALDGGFCGVWPSVVKWSAGF